MLRRAGAEVYKQMMQIYESRGSLPHQAARMTGALYLLFAALIADRRTSAPGAMATCVRRACDYIANNFALPITVADIASHVGLSRSRLYRLFMAELGASPSQALTQARIRQACALLAPRGI